MPRPLRLALIAAAGVATLSACAGGALETTAAAPAAAPEAPPEAAPESPAEAPAWRVGYTWGLMDDRRLFAATRATLEQCVIGRAALLETAEIRETAQGFDVVDRVTGERRFWMEIAAPPNEAAARTLNLNWVEGVGEEARVAFLRSVDRAVTGGTAC